jgi:hypothetical protein
MKNRLPRIVPTGYLTLALSFLGMLAGVYTLFKIASHLIPAEGDLPTFVLMLLCALALSPFFDALDSRLRRALGVQTTRKDEKGGGRTMVPLFHTALIVAGLVLVYLGATRLLWDTEVTPARWVLWSFQRLGYTLDTGWFSTIIAWMNLVGGVGLLAGAVLSGQHHYRQWPRAPPPDASALPPQER